MTDLEKENKVTKLCSNKVNKFIIFCLLHRPLKASRHMFARDVTTILDVSLLELWWNFEVSSYITRTWVDPDMFLTNLVRSISEPSRRTIIFFRKILRDSIMSMIWNKTIKNFFSSESACVMENTTTIYSVLTKKKLSIRKLFSFSSTESVPISVDHTFFFFASRILFTLFKLFLLNLYDPSLLLLTFL